ncbi:MAG: putative ABC-type transport system involved in lysophospholipase L1 biosynthesis ATPase subunit [Candidatus Krumholzibacteriia bacterium]|jgi:predicted ABC-type transport system involved in lysophospholipase L1 biosynthesis ATPase subunit
MSQILVAHKIEKSFPRAGSTVEVLQQCDFALNAGETVAVMGASGSGKSTLLNILGGLETPTSGTVTTQLGELDFSNNQMMTNWRSQGVGFVFQFHFLLPDFTALENLLIPVRSTGSNSPAEQARALDLLAQMGLADRAHHLPGEMSGGEQQRVALARAFMNRPDIVLADEPFGNLDRKIGSRLGDLLFSLSESEGTSLVIVTHDPKLAERADRSLTLQGKNLIPTESVS